jgi:V8-like Glu-specific endopeptidase
MNDQQHSAYLTAIHQLLLKHFDEQELINLCFHLGVEYADLPAAGRHSKARELITYLERRGRLPDLRAAVAQQRPHAAWPGTTPGTLPKPSPTRWQLSQEDFNRLVRILEELGPFQTHDRRLDFLSEAFAGSPRKRDILGLFDVSGTPRSVAVRLVNKLTQFGQDKPGQETLGLLINTLLTVSGESPDTDFLRGLFDRYPFGIKPISKSPRQEPPGAMIPPIKERFLKPEDRTWLASSIGNLSRFQDVPGRRNLLIDSQIPDSWIGEIGLQGGAVEVARTVINDLEGRGALPKNPKKHALGGLLEASLESFGLGNAMRAVALIFRHQLNEDRREINQLSERFGIPLAFSKDDNYQREWQLSPSLPAELRSEALKEKLEALYANGRENWLDVSFLIAGARAAQSVCRLEWNKRGHGTGFLIAPDLILTNYHVIQPPTYQGDLGLRLRTCEVRFGAFSTPEGGVSAGNKVAKLHRDALVASSDVNQLDYALLRLREPVEDGSRIVRATLSDEQIYQEQYANIIQHPLGGAMKVALRYNQVVKLMPERVYYLSDTIEGSSGSPVFDDEWQVIALHRAAGLKDEKGQLLLEANEGIPILDITSEIKPYLLGGI